MMQQSDARTGSSGDDIVHASWIDGSGVSHSMTGRRRSVMAQIGTGTEVVPTTRGLAVAERERSFDVITLIAARYVGDAVDPDGLTAGDYLIDRYGRVHVFSRWGTEDSLHGPKLWAICEGSGPGPRNRVAFGPNALHDGRMMFLKASRAGRDDAGNGSGDDRGWC